MEMLFSHHHAGGCLQAGPQPGAMALQARPQCAVLAQALRNQGDHNATCRMPADV